MQWKTSTRRPGDDRVRKRLADEAIDRYVTWREASAEVGEAYGDWSRAPAAEAAASFAEYTAALDREEWAATVYRAVIEEAMGLFGAGQGLVAAEPGATGP
jgi:hypothetical protein